MNQSSSQMSYQPLNSPASLSKSKIAMSDSFSSAISNASDDSSSVAASQKLDRESSDTTFMNEVSL